jgi:hypothetical protein
MTTRVSVVARTHVSVALIVIAGALAGGCGGDQGFGEPDPPVGEPVLPDIVPAVPKHVQMLRRASGKWDLAFTSILVNVGDGDFILRARRFGEREWQVDQVIEYSEGGAEIVPAPDARLAWGGDGHDHWHISRVASNRLVRIDRNGSPVPEEGRVDTKVGFCYYDFKKVLAKGPAKAHYVHESCGTARDVYIGMGLSPGWEDVYPFLLPGQTIDVTDLQDGRYRMWVRADEEAWFRELRRDNNVTWIDIKLSTIDRNRFASVIRTGPSPT